MAKKMRRVLALVIALALCAGQLAIPAMAEEAEAVTQQTVTTTENGTEKVTTITDAANGTQITITESVTANPETGSTTTATTTDTVTVTNKENGMTTDTSSVWESKEVAADGPNTTQEGNPTVEVETDITTVISGSENTTQDITHDNATGTETISGSLTGQETTEITGTTVTTTTTTGKLVKEETITDPVKEEALDSSDVTTGDWVEGTPTDNAWTDGKLEEGTADKGTTVTTTDEVITPEQDESVTLELTPGGDWVTVEKYIVDLADVATLPTGEEYTVTELKDADGNLIGWEVTYKAEEETKLTDVTVTDEGTWTETGSDQKYVKPALNVKEGTEGNVTTKIEEVYENGVFKGYKIIKTTVSSNDSTATAESGRETETELGEAVDNGFTLPEKPAESESVNQYGDKTTVTVTDLYENGVHVGYTELTVTTSAGGEMMYTETRNVYGTASTLTTDIVTDPVTEETVTTTTVTTTEVEEIYAMESVRVMELLQERMKTYETTIVTDSEVYELVETEGGMFFLYNGKMYAVEAIGSHGETTLEVIQPDMDLITDPGADTDLYDKNGTSNGLFSSLDNNSGNPNGYEFRYVGNGLASELLISRYKDGSLGYITNHQFALQDSAGNIHYVYCADMATTAYKGYYYKMENLDDASYFQGGSDAADHLRAIALNGYWGAIGGKETTGSLDAVKQLLIDNGHSDVAATLTEGQALSATQAAIWKYGNHDDGRYVNEDKVVSYSDLGYDWVGSGEADSKNVQVLFELLISDALMNATEVTETDLIDEDDITGAAITINGEAKDEAGAVKTDADGNKKYDTDLSFTLKVDKSSITGNLKVHVYANGDTENPIATRWLAGDGFLQYGIEADENGTYTIENLELAEGVNITLNLEGTQDLEKGVYIYTSEKINGTASQSFVGVAEGERSVDLEVDLVFTVEDPEIHHTAKTTTQKRVDTQSGTKADSRTDTKDTTRTITGGTVVTEVSHAVDVYGTVKVTETKKDITKEDRAWESFWEYVLQTVSGDDGNDDGGNGGEEILDEEVPLASAPKTGDISALWAALSLASIGGMVLISRKREED